MRGAHLLKVPTGGSFLQRFDIDGYVGKFRHSAVITRGR